MLFFYLGDGLLFCAANINELNKPILKLMVFMLDKLTVKDIKFGFGISQAWGRRWRTSSWRTTSSSPPRMRSTLSRMISSPKWMSSQGKVLELFAKVDELTG